MVKFEVVEVGFGNGDGSLDLTISNLQRSTNEQIYFYMFFFFTKPMDFKVSFRHRRHSSPTDGWNRSRSTTVHGDGCNGDGLVGTVL
ncbi:hypothetical protein Hdeb2414_s0014g00421771 [Helianthus debilis subsp. tardiflorus]